MCEINRERDRERNRQTDRQTDRRCVYAVGEKREREERKISVVSGEIGTYKDEDSTGGKQAYGSNLDCCQ